LFVWLFLYRMLCLLICMLVYKIYIARIALIAKFVSYFGPFVALWCLINIYCESTVMWFLI
jgi:hypothetical protein